MSNGFIGRAPEQYRGSVSQARGNAASAAAGAGARNISRPAAEAGAGAGASRSVRSSLATMRGNSSNIIIHRADYDSAVRRLSQIDEKIGRCLYSVCCEIEELCQESFVMPRTTQECMNISSSVKNSLPQFGSLTEDIVIQTQAFVRDTMDIG